VSTLTADSYVLFICGGRWQLPWLLYLKKKGHKIILVDPFDTSVCVPHADVFLKFDARDCNGIESAVNSAGFKIDFVSSDQTDVAVQTVAELSKRFGTRGNHPDVTKLFCNKLLNREFVQREFGRHIPPFRKVKTTDEVWDFMNETGGDIIIKPADAQSSRGIHRINGDSSNIESKVAEALLQTPQDYIIAEQFIVGREITIEGIHAGGKHHTLAISAKKHFRTGIASELLYPANLKETLKSELIAFHDSMVERTGLEFGITHAEYLIDETNNNFYLVEMACRGGGSLIPSDIVPFVSGVDVYSAFYDLQQGKTPQLVPDKRQKHAVLYFFEYPSGLVEDVKGLEKASQLPGIHSLELEFKCGDIIKSAGDDRSRQGYTIVFADSEHELEERLQRLINTLEVRINEEVKAA
jgi:biotin carboxylase